MNDTVYEKYQYAGKVAAEVREFGLGLLTEGTSLLDIATRIESRIKDKKAGIAFPVNISINDVAAHYSPRHDDTTILTKGDVVKLDVGVHVDGYIADTASTLEIGTNIYSKMIEASRKALDNAIVLMKENVDLSTVGKTVEETIVSYGYKPIDNLTGHSMQRYVLHSGMSVPNVASRLSKGKPQPGDVLAIEPFATNGAGHVVSGKGSNIYICNKTFRTALMRDQRSRAHFNKLQRKFRTLPFAQRWCVDTVANVDPTLKKLSFLGSIKHYPQLIDKNKGIVTQAEHTVIIREDGCEVIT